MDQDLIQNSIQKNKNNFWWLESEKKVIEKYGQISAT